MQDYPQARSSLLTGRVCAVLLRMGGSSLLAEGRAAPSGSLPVPALAMRECSEGLPTAEAWITDSILFLVFLLCGVCLFDCVNFLLLRMYHQCVRKGRRGVRAVVLVMVANNIETNKLDYYLILGFHSSDNHLGLMLQRRLIARNRHMHKIITAYIVCNGLALTLLASSFNASISACTSGMPLTSRSLCVICSISPGK